MNARIYFPNILELFKKKTPFNKKLKVIFNGETNDYPDIVERLNENSITSKQCQKLFRQYLTGRGFTQNNVVVNDIKDMTLFTFLNLFNDDYSLHHGAAVHVQYKIDGSKDRVKPLPFANVRLGQKDDADFSGMVALCDDDWKVSKKDRLTWFHTFNDDPRVVQSQIKDAGSIEKYKGQIFFFNPSRFDYPLAPINPVINDADSEFRIGVFRNKNLRKGVFGKKIFIIPPMIDPDLRTMDRGNMNPEQLSRFNSQNKDSKDAREALNAFVGVENNEGFMTLEMEFDGDDIDKAFKVVDVKTDIDDKLFENSEQRVIDNIRRAYNNVPQVLIANKDTGVFADSAALLEEAKKQYQENTEDDRMLIEEALQRLFRGFPGINTAVLNILPLIQMEEIEEEESDANALAQAQLRGSVGGVTALLQIQQSVAQGTTNAESGVAMIREIYGFDESTAREMLGTPEPLPPQPNTL